MTTTSTDPEVPTAPAPPPTYFVYTDTHTDPTIIKGSKKTKVPLPDGVAGELMCGLDGGKLEVYYVYRPKDNTEERLMMLGEVSAKVAGTPHFYVEGGAGVLKIIPFTP